MSEAPMVRPACVINCVRYDRAGRRSDVGLDAISEVLAVDDCSFIWMGLYEPEEGLLDKLHAHARAAGPLQLLGTDRHHGRHLPIVVLAAEAGALAVKTAGKAT